MPLASEVSVHDPKFEITISPGEGAGEVLGPGFQELIEDVTYESVDGMADMATVSLVNPQQYVQGKPYQPEGILTDLKIFQPGNEMSIKFGYGSNIKHVGRVQLIAHSPSFPQNGFMKLKLKGYTKDHLLMEDAPEEGKKRFFPKPALIADILAGLQSRHDWIRELDVDPYEFTKAMVQKAGTSDYDFIVGCANLAGAAFWVDGDENGGWYIHWRLPEDDSTILLEQADEKTFTWASGDASTLLEFKPDYAIREVVTKLKVVVRNPQNGRTFIEEFEEDATAPDPAADGDDESKIPGEHVPGGSAKIFFGSFAFDLVPNKKFKTAAEVKAWAKQWFRRRRENFVTARGKIIGDPSVMARQVHNIEGVGTGFSGRYYFARVVHKFSKSEGYVCDFSARKVLT